MVKLLEKDGWYLVAQKDSHKQFRHPKKSGKIQVPDYGNVTLKPKTTNSILKSQMRPKGGFKIWKNIYSLPYLTQQRVTRLGTP
nr:type II toxin-antitoxin system HicA family toxin [Alicyclobacillus sp. SO9]